MYVTHSPPGLPGSTCADDTLWFLEGVLKLVNELDHSMPYIVTDEAYWHFWGRPTVPRFFEDGAPRCLPCNFDPEGESTLHRSGP